mmetsp:Transcript_38575/g.110815  ORF Transcript_38575/g.110815 Transcript_38575/m.110815 type:complete len:211 (+) Transcript_38575:793-1425(+)
MRRRAQRWSSARCPCRHWWLASRRPGRTTRAWRGSAKSAPSGSARRGGRRPRALSIRRCTAPPPSAGRRRSSATGRPRAASPSTGRSCERGPSSSGRRCCGACRRRRRSPASRGRGCTTAASPRRCTKRGALSPRGPRRSAASWRRGRPRPPRAASGPAGTTPTLGRGLLCTDVHPWKSPSASARGSRRLCRRTPGPRRRSATTRRSHGG